VRLSGPALVINEPKATSRGEQPADGIDRALSIAEVVKRSGLSRTSIYEAIAKKTACTQMEEAHFNDGIGPGSIFEWFAASSIIRLDALCRKESRSIPSPELRGELPPLVVFEFVDERPLCASSGQS
jgi:hypothetical protein